ncbi:MAG: FtsX-like permease family protein [Bacteroidetes bacterium]|nr:FtsX-like permease family protein [Bacteroidota bacterium]
MLLVRLAWLNLWRNRRRTLITGASVFFAVIMAIIMRASTLGIYDNLIHNFVSFSSGYLQVNQKGFHDEPSLDLAMVFSPGLIGILKEEGGITAVIPRMQSFVLAAGSGQAKGALFMGVVPSLEKQSTGLHRRLCAGSYPESDTAQVAMLGVDLASRLGLKPGDTVILIGQGYHAVTAAGKYRVSGLLQLGSPELNQRIVYLPLHCAQQLLDAPGMATSLALQIESPAKMEALARRLRPWIDTTQLELLTWKQLFPELDQFITADSAGHIIMSGVLYLVISFGLLGTLLMMARERTHEFGILVSLGLKRSRIAFMLLCESVFISLMGCSAGIASGWLLVRWFHLNPIPLGGRLKEMYLSYGIEPVISVSNRPDVFTVQAMVVLFISLALVFVPMVKVFQLQPVAALNS